MPEAVDDDVAVEGRLEFRHSVVLHVLSDDELMRRAENQEPDGEPHGGYDQRIDKAGPRRDRYDIAVSHGGHRNHAEINDMAERDFSVDLVAHAIAVKPADGGDGTKQRKRDDEAREKCDAWREIGRGEGDARRGVKRSQLPHAGSAVIDRIPQAKGTIQGKDMVLRVFAGAGKASFTEGVDGRPHASYNDP